MAMARRSRLIAAFTFACFIIEIRAEEVMRQSSTEVDCHDTGRFYRNPNRTASEMWSSTECAKYYLCIDGTIFEFHCSQGLLFDVNRQLCDMKQNVHNCDMTTETRIPKPMLKRASCANETHLGCADGTCQPIEYFCDGAADCTDSSDEKWCDEHHDPNAALPCQKQDCVLPLCFCSASGAVIPEGLYPSRTPQMITITFTGAVNHENFELYNSLLNVETNRSCKIKATFFVSHQYTNYRHVQKLWNDGHEIAVNSITHRGPEAWWSKNATVEEWFDEMVGQANIINRFANVHMEDFRGMRVPYLSVGWNRQFMMMQEFGFVYDSTIVAPKASVPYWPYTLDYKIPHRCLGNNQRCPTRSYPGLWEMVINPLHYRNITCATLEYCPSSLSSNDIYELLMESFNRHYTTNRAPFGLHLSSNWLKYDTNLYAIRRFLNEVKRLPYIYFVTSNQTIEWMKVPTPISRLDLFEPWECNMNLFETTEEACLKPKTCKLSSRVLEHDHYMITCNNCPSSYPWIRNEFGLD